MRATRSLLLVAALAFSTSACSGGDGGPTAIELPIDSLAFTSFCSTVAIGQQCQLAVAAFTEDGQRIANPVLRWTSWHFDIAEVDDDGVVSAKGPGTATIEVTNSTTTAFARTEVHVVIPNPK